MRILCPMSNGVSSSCVKYALPSSVSTHTPFAAPRPMTSFKEARPNPLVSRPCVLEKPLA